MLRVSHAGVVGLLGLTWTVSGALAANSDCFDYGSVNSVVALCNPGFASSEFILDGNLVYVLRDYPTGLSVLDISKPTMPREIGWLPDTDLYRDLHRDGNRLYATGANSLSIIGIADPASPVLLGSLTFPAMSDLIYDIAASNGLVYIANGWQSFRIVDAANPAQPVMVGELEFPHQYVESVAVAGTRAYVGVRDLGLFVVDVSDPSAPQLIPSLFVACYADQIEVEDGLVWIGDELHGALAAWDLGQPDSPPLRRGQWSGASRCFHFAIGGGRAFICDPEVGLHVLDVSRPESIKETNLLPNLDFPYRVAFEDDFVLVDQHDQLYAVIDPSVIYAPPEPVFSLDNGETHFFLEVENGRLYDVYRRMPGWHYGLRIIDVSLPSTPQFLGSIEYPFNGYPISTYPGGFEVVGDHAYVTIANLGLQIIDVSNPRDPVVLSVTPVPEQAYDVAVHGPWVYVAIYGWEGGRIVLIDAHDLTAPSVVATIQLPNRVGRVEVMGDIVVALTEDGMLYTLSSMLSTDNQPPTILGQVDIHQALMNDLVVSGNLVFSIGAFGVRVVDCADPAAPRLVDRWYSGDGGFQLALDGDCLYAGMNYLGVVIFDVSARRLDLIGYAPSVDHVKGLALGGDRLYIGQDNGQIQALQAQCDRTPPAPRPAIPDHLDVTRLLVASGAAPISVRLQLSSARRGNVSVYDLRGRCVASLATGVLAEGEHALTWNGRDAAGRASAAGVYFLRLDTDTGTTSRSFALLH